MPSLKHKLSLLILLGWMSISFAQEAIFTGTELVNRTSEQLRSEFREYQTYRLDSRSFNAYVKAESAEREVRLKLGNEYEWHLQLVADDVRSEDYKMVIQTEAGRQVLERSENKTYSGYLLSGAAGSARLTIDDGFIYGYVEQNGETFFIEPARRFRSAAGRNEFVVYNEEDVIDPANHSCGTVHEMSRDEHNHPSTRGPENGGCYTVEIALASDYAMYSQFGSAQDLENHTLGIINNLQANYDDEFGDEIRFEVSTQYVSTCATCDPWTSSNDSGAFLDSFTNWGIGGGFDADFDVASLWTNRDFSGSVIGLAWVGTVCKNFRYNVLEDFSNNASYIRVLQAHELGHNFNCPHDGSGSPHIMAPSVSASTTWSNNSKNVINNYVNGIVNSLGCLDDCSGDNPDDPDDPDDDPDDPTGTPPVADFEIPVNNICPGSFIPLIDISTGAPTSWSWSLIGGFPASSSSQYPTIQFNLPGTYTISLTATNSSGSNTKTKTITIVESDDSDKYLLYETFENGSGAWQIDNPDGSNGWGLTAVPGTRFGNQAMYMRNFNYNAGGQKDAIISPGIDLSEESSLTLEFDYAYAGSLASSADQLTVSVSTDGGSTYTEAFNIQEDGSGNFATAGSSGNAFTPGSASDWCFGNGGSNCIRIDLSAFVGTTNAKVRIENTTAPGNNLYIDNIRLFSSCGDQPPGNGVVDFSATFDDSCAPVTAQYQELPEGEVASRQWSFPGGTPSTSTDPNPTVVYNNPGTYNAQLTVTYADGATAVENKVSFVQVKGAPTAGFSIGEIDGVNVQFINSSTNATSYSWDFGDGNTSTAPNPQHSYSSSGTFAVTLVASNACGSNQFTTSVEVEVGEPDLNFRYTNFFSCAPATLQFEAIVNVPIQSYEWFFPGGSPETSTEANPSITYNEPGIYPVTLIVTNEAGSFSLSKLGGALIDGGPEAAFDYVIEGTDIKFINESDRATNYTWRFNQVNIVTEFEPVFSASAGSYVDVLLFAYGECGVDTTRAEIFVAGPGPEPDFTSDIVEGCGPLTVQFTDTSTENPTAWEWTFEGADITTSTDQNPVVTFTEPGYHEVKLVVTNASGTNQVVKENYIYVIESPESEFSVAYVSEDSLTVQFKGPGSSEFFIYNWDFGDGNVGFGQAPMHTYAEPGDYNVILTVSSDCGESTSEMNYFVANVFTSVADTEWLENFNLYPNPNTGRFTLELQGEQQDYLQANVLSILGETLHAEELDFRSGQLTKTFSFESWPKGVYILQLRTNNQAIHRRIIIDRI